MLLNKQKLIEAIDSGIERAKQEQVEWDANVDQAERDWEQRWRDHGLPALRPLRDMLTAALKSKAHITRADLEEYIYFPGSYDDKKGKGYYTPFNRGYFRKNYENRWVASHNYGPRPVLKITAFETLKDFLAVVAEDTVSSAQLEKAGFRNLSKLFDAAANGYWAD